MPLAGWLVGCGARRIACGSGAALEYLGYAAFTFARAQHYLLLGMPLKETVSLKDFLDAVFDP